MTEQCILMWFKACLLLEMLKYTMMWLTKISCLHYWSCAFYETSPNSNNGKFVEASSIFAPFLVYANGNYLSVVALSGLVSNKGINVATNFIKN